MSRRKQLEKQLRAMERNRSNLDRHIAIVRAQLGLPPQTNIMIEHTHDLWVKTLPTVYGIGPKRMKAIMEAMAEKCSKRSV